MQDSEKHIEQLKSNFDSFIAVPKSTYKQLLPYLLLKKYPSGTVIKHGGGIESKARFILEGSISLSWQRSDGSLVTRMIFLPNEVVFDAVSFNTNSPSDYILKAITDVKVFELRKAEEVVLLSKFPELIGLSMHLNHMFQEKLMYWFIDFLDRPKEEAYSLLMEIEKQVGKKIPVKDISGMMSVCKTTVANIKKSRKRKNSKS